MRRSPAGATIRVASTLLRPSTFFPLGPLVALLGLLVGAPAARAQRVSDPPERSDSAIALEGIVVTATPVPLTPDRLGSHVSVLSGDVLRAHGVTRVADALRSLSGVTLAQSGSFGSATSAFVRGGESDYVLVLLDGVPLNDPGGAIDLSGLTTENIERIEVVRGPASALYGSDAVAGVIQIITRTGAAGFGGSATVRGGSYGSLDGILELTGANDSGSFSLSTAHYGTDGILAFNNAHRNTVVSGRAELRTDDGLVARVTARLLDRKYRFPTDAAGQVVDTNQFTFTQDAAVGIEVTKNLGEAVNLRALVTLHDVDTGTDDAPDGPGDNLGFYGYESLDALRRITGDLRANLRVGSSTDLTIGTEVEQQRVRSFNESLSEFGASIGRSNDSRENVAAYAHAATSVGSLALNGGMRVEHNEQFGDFASFQFGSAVAVDSSTRLRASIGRGVKEPTFFEAFATGFVVGNPELEPERSLSWEIGVERSLPGGIRAGLTWFDQSFRDLIQYTSSPPEPSAPNYFNVAAADSRGLEAELSGPVGPLTLSGGWTWLHTEVTDSGFDEGPSAMFVDGESLIRRPRSEATLGVAGSFAERVRWSADLRWVDRRSDRDFTVFPAERVVLPPYAVVNASLEATLFQPGEGKPGLDVLFRAENIGDAAYEEIFGFAAPGRGLYVGGRLRWSDG